MSDLTFRSARKDEIETVFELLKEAAIWLNGKGIDHWQNWLDPPDSHIRWIKQGFDTDEFYLVEREGRVIGCFRLQWQDPLFWGERDDCAGYIHTLTTRRDGAGTGRLVLKLVETYCVERGKQFLRLDCGAINHGLRSYYESCGFFPVGETKIEGELLTLYEKTLDNNRLAETFEGAPQP